MRLLTCLRSDSVRLRPLGPFCRRCGVCSSQLDYSDVFTVEHLLRFISPSALAGPTPTPNPTPKGSARSRTSSRHCERSRPPLPPRACLHQSLAHLRMGGSALRLVPRYSTSPQHSASTLTRSRGWLISAKDAAWVQTRLPWRLTVHRRQWTQSARQAARLSPHGAHRRWTSWPRLSQQAQAVLRRPVRSQARQ
jgi:hypothetical protein